MAQVKYIVTFVDSIENTLVTGSVIAPFFPPTSKPFITEQPAASTYIYADTADFVGYNPPLIEEEPLNLFTEFQNKMNVRTNAILDVLEGKIVKDQGLIGYLSSRGLPSSLSYRAGEALRLGLVKSTDEYIAIAKGPRTESANLNILMIEKLEEERLNPQTTSEEVQPNPVPTSYGFRVTTPSYKEKVFYQSNPELTPTQTKQENPPPQKQPYPTNEGLVAYLRYRKLPTSLKYRGQQALRFGLVKSIDEYLTISRESQANKSPEAKEKSKNVNIAIIKGLEKERLDSINTQQSSTTNTQDTPTYPTNRGLDTYLKSRGLPITLEYKIQEIVRLGITTESVYVEARAKGKNGDYNIQLISKLEDERVAGTQQIQEIDLGVVVLERIVAEPAKEITPFLEIDSKAIIENIPEIDKEQGLTKLRSVLEGRGEDLKNLLVTAIIPVLTEFGLTEIHKLIEKAPTQELLEQAMSKLKKLCPTQAKLQQLILLKSRYSDQVNKFYTSLNTIQTTVISSDKITQALNTTLQVISTARQAGNIALSLIPVTPGAPPALINTQKEVEEKLRPILEKISTVLTKMGSTFVLLGSIIALIQQLLSMLDIVIRFCAEKLNIPYQTINTTMGAIPKLATPSPSTYKGFTFEIITDTQNKTAYPKRYAVAKDKYNVIQLKSQSSFTPNPDVLIAELRFIIDTRGLRGD